MAEIADWYATSVVTNTAFSADRKCELLVILNDKLQNHHFYNVIFCTIIDLSYNTLEGVIPSPILSQNHAAYRQEREQQKAIDFVEHFGTLFSVAGMIGSPNGKFSLNYKIFDKYNFPRYREE
jgi:hypothetical protein